MMIQPRQKGIGIHLKQKQTTKTPLRVLIYQPPALQEHISTRPLTFLAFHALEQLAILENFELYNAVDPYISLDFGVI